MEPLKIILSSNRGSYNKLGPIPSEFNQLEFKTMPVEIFRGASTFDPKEWDAFINRHSSRYIVGYLNYDFGYELVTGKPSTQKKIVDLPTCWFGAFEPQGAIIKTEISPLENLLEMSPMILHQEVSKDRYLDVVNQLKKHIQLGDIYEVNYCIPFTAENVELKTENLWHQLSKKSPMPFSAFIETPDFAIISASPERFIKKTGQHLFIQPMKGTKPRGKNVEEDLKFIDELKNDPKEKSENVMIVDLSRNDLSKLAKKGTVKVDELFGVYAFQPVHQMISTVSCELPENVTLEEVLKATYPMGSMTGAPKKRSMEIIDEYEDFSRGPFSGMLGYIDPSGNYDFNVMIRTIFYDKKQKKIFIAVGSAITAKSNVEKEYEECLIKLQPLLKALNATLR